MGEPRKIRWRPWLRAIHRDVGYLAVGLTVVYAVSGIAVNHIDDWDSNFVRTDETVAITEALDADPERAAAQVAEQLGITETPTEVFPTSAVEISVSYDHHSVTINRKAMTAHHTGQSPRFMVRALNWLHLNRGKQAWTLIADGYAGFLLLLAISGLCMLPGRKGLLGRGGILVLIGAAVPILYVTFSGP